MKVVNSENYEVYAQEADTIRNKNAEILKQKDLDCLKKIKNRNILGFVSIGLALIGFILMFFVELTKWDMFFLWCWFIYSYDNSNYYG